VPPPGAKLVDNHLINNPLFTVVNANSLPSAIWGKVRAIRQVVYETIRALWPPEMSFVFTIQLFQDDPQDHAGICGLGGTCQVAPEPFGSNTIGL
jgi:hypothetical protein